LKKELYTATLIQGIDHDANYKSKDDSQDETDWVRTTEAHEAIITRSIRPCSKLMRDDTRTLLVLTVFILLWQGFLSDCESAMVRNVSRCGDLNMLLHLRGYKNDKSTCSPTVYARNFSRHSSGSHSAQLALLLTWIRHEQVKGYSMGKP
jgi:hypothetical protein